MARARFLFAVVVVSIISLVFIAAWYILSYRGGSLSPSGFMGQMMGSQYGQGTGMPIYVWAPSIALLGLLAVGGVGLAYYLLFPQIRTAEQERQSPTAAATPQPGHADWGLLLRTSKEDERKVLEVIAAHQGSYLQKFIVKESGLSKLKTHRIIARLAERGIVTAQRSGNTNMIRLASWLSTKDGAAPPSLAR